jgi:hypothetical protein
LFSRGFVNGAGLLTKEIKPMKAITAVFCGALALLAATSAMAQSARGDAACRQWASQYANWYQAQANNAAAGSMIGTGLLGAGIGAIAGGGRGAAIGAGAGMFTGALAGGARAQGAGNRAWQDAFDYCMWGRRSGPRWR